MGTKPGDLYLGQVLDAESSRPMGARLNLPSHQLTTHGVIVGMTGSGKTGLGVVLLEEILSAGIPALILDPKGDMGNLLLNFPAFLAQDFEPWVDRGEARRKGVTTDQLAEETARLWQHGLSASGIESGRMDRLRREVDFRVITPGSSAGISLNVLGSLSPPGVSLDEDAETVRDEIEGLVSGILVMAGLDTDPSPAGSTSSSPTSWSTHGGRGSPWSWPPSSARSSNPRSAAWGCLTWTPSFPSGTG
jgi:hypothetical protein